MMIFEPRRGFFFQSLVVSPIHSFYVLLLRLSRMIAPTLLIHTICFFVYTIPVYADTPGLLDEIPSFNEHPFTIPSGESLLCYKVPEDLVEVGEGIAERIRSSLNIDILRGDEYFFSNVKNTSIYIAGQRYCSSKCDLEIFVVSDFNVFSTGTMTTDGRTGIEVFALGGDSKNNAFEFGVSIFGLGKRNSGIRFNYIMYRGVDNGRNVERREYWIGRDESGSGYCGGG